jgi:hypothetical protein
MKYGYIANHTTISYENINEWLKPKTDLKPLIAHLCIIDDIVMATYLISLNVELDLDPVEDKELLEFVNKVTNRINL